MIQKLKKVYCMLILQKKEFESVEVLKNSASYSILKPLYDTDLKHLGVVEIEFNFDNIAKIMETNIVFELFFMHKKSLFNATKQNSVSFF